MLSNNIDTLYILSAGHSGSTLLNLILGTHSQAVAVSELTYWPANITHDEACTCGRTVRACPFWREVAGRLERDLGIDALQNPERLELGFMNAPRGIYRASAGYRALWKLRRMTVFASLASGVPLPSFMRHRFDLGVRNRLALHAAIRAASGSFTIVDASKDYLQGIAVYRARPARTRLILLVRDGRAVFYSNLKRGFGRPYSLRVWRNYYRHALPVIRRGVEPVHVLTVRYEDLASDSQGEVKRICEFAGLAYEPSMLDTGSKQHHITSGNDMRFRPIAAIRQDDRWRGALQDDDRAYFEDRAGELNRQLGYE